MNFLTRYRRHFASKAHSPSPIHGTWRETEKSFHVRLRKFPIHSLMRKLWNCLTWKHDGERREKKFNLSRKSLLLRAFKSEQKARIWNSFTWNFFRMKWMRSFSSLSLSSAHRYTFSHSLVQKFTSFSSSSLESFGWDRKCLWQIYTEWDGRDFEPSVRT